MPTTSQRENEQRQHTRMNLVSLLPAGNQATILFLAAKIPAVCTHRHCQDCRQIGKNIWKANCPSDNEEIQD
jgi:hypothetical protein